MLALHSASLVLQLSEELGDSVYIFVPRVIGISIVMNEYDLIWKTKSLV